MKKKVLTALNKQITAELYSAQLYLSMAAYFYSESLDGMAHWMRIQADEEQTHAMKLYDYVHERGARVTLSAIEKPPADWAAPIDAFTDAYKHEQKVTALINKLMNLAKTESDHATAIFLEWFVTEQVEEEANVSKIVDRMKLMQDAPGGLFMMDNELAGRTLDTPGGA